MGSAQDIGWLRRFDGTTAGTRARVGTPANGWAKMSSEALPVEEALSRAEQRASPLYAGRVEVYAKAITGHFRTIKWAALVVLLGIYYLAPWMRWDRGPGAPNQAVLVDIAGGRLYFFGIEIWPQEFYYLTGLLIMAAFGLFLATSLFGRAVVRLRLPADGLDRPVHAGRALDRGRPQRSGCASTRRRGRAAKIGASASPSTRPGC